MPHLFLNSSISQGLLIFIHTAGRKTAGKKFSTQSTFYLVQKAHVEMLTRAGKGLSMFATEPCVLEKVSSCGESVAETCPTICWPGWSSSCRVSNCRVDEATPIVCKKLCPVTFLYCEAVLTSHVNGPWFKSPSPALASLVKAEQLGVFVC